LVNKLYTKQQQKYFMLYKRICKKGIVVLALIYLGINNTVLAQSTIVSITHDDVNILNRYLSPLVNGSFETGGPHDGVLPDKTYFWSRSGNTHVPNGWSATGDALSYGSWGSRQTAGDAQYGPGTSVVNTIISSTGGGDFMIAPGYGNGNNLVYFGNYELCAGAPAAAYNSTTGEYVPAASVPAASSITWVPGSLGGTPYTISAPVTLSQTITGLVPNSSYDLEFWVTGEAGSGNTFEADGIFELKIDNNRRWLACPGTGNTHGLGTSERYHVRFTTGATQTAVTISFINYGHFHRSNNAAMPVAWFVGGVATGNMKATELALDDVIINPVGGTFSQANASTLMSGIYKNYDSVPYLSFDVKFNYTSDTAFGNFVNETLTGSYTMAGKKAKYSLGDIDFMQNDSFFIAVYRKDKMILVDDPKTKNIGSQLPNRIQMDSLLANYALHYALTNTVYGLSVDSNILQYTRKDSVAQFDKFSIVYDNRNKQLCKILYEFPEQTQIDTSATGSGAFINVIQKKKFSIDFFNYRFDNYDDQLYNINNYIYLENGVYRPVTLYADFRIYNSKPNTIYQQ
jgi:hypothetical protein